MSKLDDDILVEECLYINDVETPQNVTKCYQQFFDTGKLTKDQRQLLENFHLLSYCRYYITV